MDEAEKKRKIVRRSAAERIKEIDDKIAHHKDCIMKLEKKKENILNPQSRASKAAKFKLMMAKAKDAGFTEEEIDALFEKAISKKIAKSAE